MAVSLLALEVSDLCLGKPALWSLSVSATVGEALSALRRSSDPYLSVWSCDHYRNASRSKLDVNECRCIGRALGESVSVLLPKVPGLVRHLEPNASLLEAIDLILEGAQNLVVPIHSPLSRKKLIPKPSSNSTLHNNREYCWLTQEDIIRYLLNCIGLFCPIPNHTLESLNIIDTKSILALCYDEPASAALPLISESLVKQTSVAIVDKDGKLIGEISPYILNSCDESVAAAIATLSAGDFMAYIDCGDPPEDLIRLVKERLEERNLGEALELLEEESGISPSSSCHHLIFI
ncbi:hypothetical protein GH714_002171 [Hevea brasiliensis]|uniref:Uncharacterized protein n=1 Tax=Hevea brasiliensis TaxID=3981 RepID=A0A6A6LAU7_HEVBR|nr:hypothetical protein GH714_002171 [Hevea brasiliensis]